MQNERSQTGFERVHFLCRVICMSSPEATLPKESFPEVCFFPALGFSGEICPFPPGFPPSCPTGMELLAAAGTQSCHCSVQEPFVPTLELIRRVWGVNFYNVGILCKPLFPAYLQKSVAGCALQCSGVNNMNLFHMRSSSLVIKHDDV